MMSGKIIVVIGPHGCGKTRNAESIRAYFDAHCVLEEDDVRMSGISVDALGYLAERGVKAVVLTNDSRYLRKIKRRAGEDIVEAVEFDDLPPEAIPETVSIGAMKGKANETDLHCRAVPPVHLRRRHLGRDADEHPQCGSNRGQLSK